MSKWKERLDHYTSVAKGSKDVKADSKFSPAEQKAYARGARDEMNRNSRIFKYKNSTELERAGYKERKAIEKVEYLKKAKK